MSRGVSAGQQGRSQSPDSGSCQTWLPARNRHCRRGQGLVSDTGRKAYGSVTRARRGPSDYAEDDSRRVPGPDAGRVSLCSCRETELHDRKDRSRSTPGAEPGAVGRRSQHDVTVPPAELHRTWSAAVLERVLAAARRTRAKARRDGGPEATPGQGLPSRPCPADTLDEHWREPVDQSASIHRLVAAFGQQSCTARIAEDAVDGVPSASRASMVSADLACTAGSERDRLEVVLTRCGSLARARRASRRGRARARRGVRAIDASSSRSAFLNGCRPVRDELADRPSAPPERLPNPCSLRDLGQAMLPSSSNQRGPLACNESIVVLTSLSDLEVGDSGHRLGDARDRSSSWTRRCACGVELRVLDRLRHLGCERE